MRSEHNKYLERLETLEAARKSWAESEWRLQFLRTETGQDPKEPTDEELIAWHQQQQQ